MNMYMGFEYLALRPAEDMLQTLELILEYRLRRQPLEQMSLEPHYFIIGGSNVSMVDSVLKPEISPEIWNVLEASTKRMSCLRAIAK